MINQYKWAIWFKGELTCFVISPETPKIGDIVYMPGEDPDCDDEAVITKYSESANGFFDLIVERVEMSQ